jgi:transposase InsO family protein
MDLNMLVMRPGGRERTETEFAELLRQADFSLTRVIPRAKLNQCAPGQGRPAPSTIGELLRREQLSKPRKRRRRARPSPMPLRAALASNDIWCIDFKGPFRTGDGARCGPLTVTDAYSRYLLCVASGRSTRLATPTAAASKLEATPE